MYSTKVKFDHGCSDIRGALNLNNRRASELTALLFFVEIDQTFTVKKLYDNEEEAPREFVTKTGTLSTALDDAQNLNEVVFLTYQWTKNLNMHKEVDGGLAALTMLYAIANQNKEQFIDLFVKKMED